MLNVPNSSNDGFLPYMSWNKLEARPRQTDFNRVLRTEVRDALWMLARQFQMGEFKGNDTGSGIITKALMEYSSIYAYSRKDDITHVKPYDLKQMPLEPMVENVAYNFSTKERVKMGQVWRREIKKLFSSSSAAAIFTSVAANAFFVIDTAEPNAGSSAVDKVAKSLYFSQHKTASFIKTAALTNQTLDGGGLFSKSKTLNPYNDFATLLGSSFTGLGISSTTFNAACDNYAKWVKKMYSLDTQSNNGELWNKEKLEYELDLYSDDMKRLTSDNAHNGSLDWFSFENNSTAGVSFPTVTTTPAQPVLKEMLMTDNRFAGMPSSRWWEFENGKVNFGKLEGDTTDMAKIMLAQFALVYQDDWFVIPYRIPVGSYSKIHGLVVTDVFGVKTYIANHTEEYDGNNFVYVNDTWKDWSWMDVSEKTNVVNFSKPAGRMLLLPTLAAKQESAPIESVTFARDEISNLVWAIEKIVPDYLGRGADAQQVSTDYRARLEALAPAAAPPPPAADDAKLDYTLMNTVPENWIPFIVKHIPGSIREVQLQRASMPRIVGSLPVSLARPRTGSISYGLDSSPVTGYYINEEEVSRAGTKIETTFQRTRWYNGKTIMWVGRNRTTGRGQGSSGLVFDKVSDK
jgi:hypothetical protein